ncbi:MAG: alanine racemase [Chlamydiae bacterium]|nr:alanine racemase [Chlamydiota bacterium]
MALSLHPNKIEIDISQFQQNIRLIKAAIGDTKICLPVKANAYGHGLCPIGHAAVQAGVEYLAVAHLQEGILLREAGIAIAIFVMGAIHEEQIEDLLKYDLEFSISSMFKAELVAKVCTNLSKIAKIHIEIDTGMNRTGVRMAGALKMYDFILRSSCFILKGVYTHLATADRPLDPYTSKQIHTFKEFLTHPSVRTKDWTVHCANSAGVLFYPQSYFDMVRPSLLSFGYKPAGVLGLFQDIEPCFTLKSKVSFFKIVEAGAGIGYGRRHVTAFATRIVTIPIGYGDGYRRALSQKGQVLIRGKRYPIVGNICMDQCMVDVGEDEVRVGDEVVLIGRQGQHNITVEEIASICDTIPYEILCGFNDRIPRVYTQ